MGLIVSLLSNFWRYLIELRMGLTMYFTNSADPAAELCREEMQKAKSFQDWKAAAIECDRLLGYDEWKEKDEAELYDFELIRQRYKALKQHRQNNNTAELIFVMRAGLVRGLGGTNNEALLRKCNWGTKTLVEKYVNEMCKCLFYLCRCSSGSFSPITKVRFFTDMRQAYGRTALLLSGGGSLGLYHFGVVKCLYEQGLLPKIISGASIGALLTAMLGISLESELASMFEPNAIDFGAFEMLGQGSAQRKIARFLKHGVLMDMARLQEFCQTNIGDYTFLEAYQRTQRVINISVASRQSSEAPWLLNYLTAPNVLIWSAALASCSLPGVYSAVDLMAKDHEGRPAPWTPSRHIWSDATLESADLPMTRLSELFNVNNFIVSQVNPHVIPFLWNTHSSTLLGRAMAAVKFPVLAEMQHLALQTLVVFPGAFRVLQELLTQKYAGDVTVVPNVGWADLLQFFGNPCEEMCRNAMETGERSTWPYISQLRNSLAIELCLHRCLKAVRQGTATAGSPPDSQTDIPPEKPRFSV